jgi:hypothetical protein
MTSHSNVLIRKAMDEGEIDREIPLLWQPPGIEDPPQPMLYH